MASAYMESATPHSQMAIHALAVPPTYGPAAQLSATGPVSDPLSVGGASCGWRHRAVTV